MNPNSFGLVNKVIGDKQKKIKEGRISFFRHLVGKLNTKNEAWILFDSVRKIQLYFLIREAFQMEPINRELGVKTVL